MIDPFQIFNQPVDAKLENLPDYHLIIERPMDLGTIKHKLNSKVYSSAHEFVDDVRLTFANAKKYNAKTHEVYHIAQMLEAIFEAWWKDVTTTMDIEVKDGDYDGDNNNLCSMLKPRGPNVVSLASKQNDKQSQPRMHEKLPKPPKPHSSDPHKRQMRPEEKDKLRIDLESLPVDKVERVAIILRSRQNPPNVLEDGDEIVFELDDIDNDTLWELDRFVTNYKKSRGKKKNLQNNSLEDNVIGVLACNP